MNRQANSGQVSGKGAEVFMHAKSSLPLVVVSDDLFHDETTGPRACRPVSKQSDGSLVIIELFFEERNLP